MHPLVLSAPKAPYRATRGEAMVGLCALKPKGYAPKYALSFPFFPYMSLELIFFQQYVLPPSQPNYPQVFFFSPHSDRWSF